TAMQGAIFDMDGLLIDSETIWQEEWHAMAAERGITLPESFAAEICGTGGARTREILRRAYRTDEPEPILRECSARVNAREAQGVPLMRGVHTILDGLRAQGYRIAVASSSPMHMIEHNLRLNGIEDRFDALVSGRTVAHGKPAPDVFLLAAERLGLPPEVCWVFEDSLNGVEAGWRARCRTVMIPDKVPPTEEARRRCWGIFPDLGAAWDAIRAEEE
ncbi:MAG: HAD family phosphatase, partial [Oscillospiraceae bacterium]|nr:HAD family phosphatase [Oscillospiraceae bacterium]